MATTFEGRAPARPLDADAYERGLAFAAIVLFVASLAAILRGQADWARVPAGVWLHLATVLLATGLTPVILLRRRGDRRHRVLGTVWVAAMFGTAIVSLFVRHGNPPGFSVIHILSVGTIAMAPLIWWTARTGNVARHRRAVRGTVTGALLIAGFFTFPFDRLLGHWLFG